MNIGLYIKQYKLMLILIKKSNGMYSKELRKSVNPNLTILLKRRYLNVDYKIVKEETIGASDEDKANI